jgi:two-component system response regulator RegA
MIVKLNRGNMERNIILVDDDELFRDRLARAFRNRGFEVYTATNCDEALGIIRKHQPAMAVVDLRMPGRSGWS